MGAGRGGGVGGADISMSKVINNQHAREDREAVHVVKRAVSAVVVCV